MPNITISVNNQNYELNLNGEETLLEVLREHLHLTGTKSACHEAECGACTVLLNGKSVLACITLACDVAGQDITTIEGLAKGEDLHPIQDAFLEKGAVQCGFCMPGMILASKSLLDRNPEPSREEIKTALNGNICRCAGYTKIFEAVEHAAKKIKNQPPQQ
ncbi:MAG: (2Fe-2S)-binding protein [Candidatus Omnitrophica bacterium]|nr:(2Fe-2S)-binding protein [Candidatus Omnitrophota bacterium]